MSSIKFKFDAEKTVEAIIYLAHHYANEPTVMAICKLLYFADKTSLQDYGRFISGDAYFAMRHGPVPSHSYDMMKEAVSGSLGFQVSNSKIIPLREPDLEKFSKSDLKCLETTIEAYRCFPAWQLRQLSHDPAWQKNEPGEGTPKSIPIPIEDIIDTIDNGEELLEFLQETQKLEKPRLHEPA